MTCSEPRSPLVNLADYERLASDRSDPALWDFIAGGSEDEATLEANRGAFRRWALRPRVLSGVENADISIGLLGAQLASPVLVAPVAYQRLVHPEGELATARGAGQAGTLMIVSTMSSCTLEEIARSAHAPLWFQLYVMRSQELTLSLVRRAEDAGYQALVITVDTPRMGRRERDRRNAFCLPNDLRPANLPSAFDNCLHRTGQGKSGVAVHTDQCFESQLTWSTISWLKTHSRLPIVLKGVLTREDAELAIELGVHAVIVSNHGGRQLDGAPSSLDALPEVVAGVDARCPVLLDGGIRRGTDALKARALGAQAVLIGRPVLWGLLAGGAQGVAGVLRLLCSEIEHAMVLAGRARWADIDHDLVSPRPHGFLA